MSATPTDPRLLKADIVDGMRMRSGYFFFDCMSEIINGPWPHMVTYRPKELPRPVYVSPDQFRWHRQDSRSPSDCLWIVPGTMERRL